MPCPICGAQTKPIFVKHGYPIHRCVACQHRCAAVQPSADHVRCVYGDDYFHASDQGGSAGYPDYLGEADLLQAHGWYYAEVLKPFMTLGTVLDVGAAAGFILKGLLERGWHGVGLEPNAQMTAYGRAHLGLSMVTGALEDAQIINPVSKASFDLLTMIQVIAHFHDLHKALTHAAALTRPGGFWLIESWDRTSWPARLLGRYWHEYSPPSVLHWFSPTGLAQLAGQFGFVEVARGRPRKRLNGAHAKSLLRYKLQTLPGHQALTLPLALIPDRIAIPYPNFDLFWMLLQKQPTAEQAEGSPWATATATPATKKAQRRDRRHTVT